MQKDAIKSDKSDNANYKYHKLQEPNMLENATHTVLNGQVTLFCHLQTEACDCGRGGGKAWNTAMYTEIDSLSQLHIWSFAQAALAEFGVSNDSHAHITTSPHL